MAEIPCPVAEAARETPSAVALQTGARRWTYGEWDAHIGCVAGHLQGQGVEAGDRVAILGNNSEAYLTHVLALSRLVATVCLLNPRWPPDRLASVVGYRDLGVPSAPVIRVRHVIADDAFAATLPWPCRPLDTAAETVSGGQARVLDLDRYATIYFTSGSAGMPKAVLHRLRNHHANARASNRNIALGSGDCWLLSLPLYHVAGMGILWRCVTARAAIAIPDNDEDLVDAMARHGVTHVSLVTTQLYRFMQSAQAVDVLRNLKAILLGGSSVAPSLIDRALELNLPLYKTYGLTEAASQVATTRAGDRPAALYTSGRPIIDGTVRVDGDGHILIRGETRFEGYVHGDEVERPFDSGGWFDTGDRGEWTDDGCLRVIGRADTMFVSGGENVQPEDVERALCRIEGVEEAVVVPIPDEEFGHLGAAFVRSDRTAADIETALRASLPAYMIPRLILPWPAHLVEGQAKVSRARFQAYALSLTARAD